MRKQTQATKVLPKHIAIIMDGNGRWAKKRGLPRSAGHSAGSGTFKKIVRYANKIGIPYLTVYAFSTENWKRPQTEVAALMNILENYLRDAANYRDENIVCRFIGDRTRLPEELQRLMVEAEQGSAQATGTTVNIALNYGGRDEIMYAVRRIADQVANGTLQPSDVDETVFEANLYTDGQPDPDLVIRPSGEIRLSNFLIWQTAYAEFWFSDVLWPDFKPKHLDQAIEAYGKRERRYGGV